MKNYIVETSGAVAEGSESFDNLPAAEAAYAETLDELNTLRDPGQDRWSLCLFESGGKVLRSAEFGEPAYPNR